MRRVGAKGPKERKAATPPKSLKNSVGMKQDAPAGVTSTVGKSKAGKKRKGAR